ncbi:MAG: hypothetical protein JXR64_12640 [Spirochaetales bacterium]|nr:hypothetical protein [Spirochaetales bacterium]
MKNRILLIYLLISVSSFSQNLNYVEYNDIGFSDINLTPSISIFYANKSIYENREFESQFEYLRSLYILALAYDAMSDTYTRDMQVDNAYNLLNKKNFKDISNSFLIYIANNSIERGLFDRYLFLKNNTVLKRTMDEETILIFEVLDIKYRLAYENYFSTDLYIKLESELKNMKMYDSLSQVQYQYGTYLEGKDINKAIDIYTKLSESENIYYRVEALVKLWEITKNIFYLEEAYLKTGLNYNYTQTIDVINKLKIEYQRLGKYQKLSEINEKINYFNLKQSQFVLEQYRNLYDFGFEKQVLQEDLERAVVKNSLQTLIIIFMSVVVLILIIVISIQNYRLRGFNI